MDYRLKIQNSLMKDFAAKPLQKKELINYKNIARQGIKINRKGNTEAHLSPDGDRPFICDYPHAHFMLIP
jgi:hypothetical protein